MKCMDLTGYIARLALLGLTSANTRAERQELSEREFLQVLDLLENPPTATDRLVRTARVNLTSG
jgi:uncharacterized protein (DUF1778 family)